ncbi:MAG: hypothetical protein ACKVOP_00425 [Sphingomonadaceae bacterium]
MATRLNPSDLDIQEQLARIREIGSNGEKLILESQKLQFERFKLEEERLKMEAERLKAGVETELFPRNMIFQAMLATAALLGAGAAIAKLFFP